MDGFFLGSDDRVRRVYLKATSEGSYARMPTAELAR